MSCPTCHFGMMHLITAQGGNQYHWCSNCGTFAEGDESGLDHSAPTLVVCCQSFERRLRKPNQRADIWLLWEQLGIGDITGVRTG